VPKYGGRRYGYGRPGRRVRGYYRARSRCPAQFPAACSSSLAIWLSQWGLSRLSTASEGAGTEPVASADPRPSCERVLMVAGNPLSYWLRLRRHRRPFAGQAQQ